MLKIKDEGDYVEIKMKLCRLFFKKQCNFINTMNDLLIGVFFVLGSFLNFFEFGALYGKILYFLGSFILVCRALRNLHEHTTIDYKKEEKTEMNKFYY